MGFSPVSTGIFAFRNVDKAEHGDKGRGVVAGFQTLNFGNDVASNILKYDNGIAKTARSAVSVFSDMAKESKAIDYAGKALKWGCDNVNPLICASGALKVATSDDKVQAGITEAAALSTMFAGENFVKANYDKAANSKYVKEVAKAAKETEALKPIFEYVAKHKLGGKADTFIKGLVLVGASITSYSIGELIGKDASKGIGAKLGIKA